jgi:hypothetical protein
MPRQAAFPAAQTGQEAQLRAAIEGLFLPAQPEILLAVQVAALRPLPEAGAACAGAQAKAMRQHGRVWLGTPAASTALMWILMVPSARPSSLQTAYWSCRNSADLRLAFLSCPGRRGRLEAAPPADAGNSYGWQGVRCTCRRRRKSPDAARSAALLRAVWNVSAPRSSRARDRARIGREHDNGQRSWASRNAPADRPLTGQAEIQQHNVRRRLLPEMRSVTRSRRPIRPRTASSTVSVVASASGISG